MAAPIKMRLTHEAISDLEALADILGEPSGPLMARRMIMASLVLGSTLGSLPAIPSRRPAPPSGKTPPMGQFVMRLPTEAIDALETMATQRGLESPAMAARAVLIEAMQAEGLTANAVNPTERTRRETADLSHAQAEALRLITRIVILVEQVESVARNWRDQALLDRARQSRSALSLASGSLRLTEPAAGWADAIKATGNALNALTRALHAGDSLPRYRSRLDALLDELDRDAEALCRASS